MASLIEAVASTALKQQRLVAVSCFFFRINTMACYKLPGFGCNCLPVLK